MSGPFKLNPPLTFIITNSYDLTANKLVERLGVDRVFRYNFDIWQQYPLVIDETGFCIRDAVGREVRQQHVAKVLWRKPISRYGWPDIGRTRRHAGAPCGGCSAPSARSPRARRIIRKKKCTRPSSR